MEALGRKLSGLQGFGDLVQTTVVVPDERQVEVLLVEVTPTQVLVRWSSFGMVRNFSCLIDHLSVMNRADPTRKKPPDHDGGRGKDESDEVSKAKIMMVAWESLGALVPSEWKILDMSGELGVAEYVSPRKKKPKKLGGQQEKINTASSRKMNKRPKSSVAQQVEGDGNVIQDSNEATSAGSPREYRRAQ